MASNGLSEAGEDFGLAFCVPDSMSATPLEQLPPEMQTCVNRVGAKFQEDVDQKMGFNGGQVADTPLIQRFTVTGPQGSQVGTLTFADGAVTYCATPEAAKQACGLVGYGLDGFHAAHDLLEHLGFQMRPTG